jgi:hypothetical protein
MMSDSYLALFIQFVGILAVWVRLEMRLSRLEGRFDMFFTLCRGLFKSPPPGPDPL